MKYRNYEILGIPVKINSNVADTLFVLDKAYCSFIQKRAIKQPLLELFVHSNNGDIKDLGSIDIYAVTPRSFDGWERSSKAWVSPRSNVNKFVSEINNGHLPSIVKRHKDKKVFKIKTIIDIEGIHPGCLRRLYFFINLFVLDCVEKSLHIIHGGALEWKNKGVILSGQAGSGKSTLTYALAKAGLTYLTDECILFNTDTQRLMPYPLSPSFEKESGQLFKEVKDSFEEDSKIHNENVKSFVNVKEIGINAKNTPVNPQVIIFPKYSPDKKPKLKQLSKGQAAKLLTDQIFIFHETSDEKLKDKIAKLLTDKCKCYELVSNKLDETVALVKKTLSS